MVEIYGLNLEPFFKTICADGKYKAELEFQQNDKYEGLVEIWSISQETLDYMSNMTEEEFIKIAGDESGWRYAEGSNLGTPTEYVMVNGKEMKAWRNDDKYDDDEDCESLYEFEYLTDYLCNHIGASQPKNVCALCVDLAKANNMTMGELFEKYERIPKDKFDVVCDIETLGTESNHLVYEIAAIIYSRNKGLIHGVYHKSVDVSQLPNIEVSGSTLAWWLKTNAELFKQGLTKQITAQRFDTECDLFTDFHSWLVDRTSYIRGATRDNFYFWGNGILFDNRFIKDKFTHYGLEYPILYRNDRDIRTLIEMAADKVGIESNQEFIAQYKSQHSTDHCAIDDVKNEYYAMRAAWDILKIYK